MYRCFTICKKIDLVFEECSRKWQPSSQFDWLPAQPTTCSDFFHSKLKLAAYRRKHLVVDLDRNKTYKFMLLVGIQTKINKI